MATADPASAPSTTPDLDHEAPPDRPGRQDLLLPLLLDPRLLQLPATVRAAARCLYRDRLVHLLRRLPVSVPPMLLPALAPCPFGVGLRLSPRERRRLPLAGSERGLQLALQVGQPPSHLLVVSMQ